MKFKQKDTRTEGEDRGAKVILNVEFWMLKSENGIQLMMDYWS